MTCGPAFGAYPQWQAQGIAAGVNGETNVLWNNLDASAALWTMAADNTYLTSSAYGPY